MRKLGSILLILLWLMLTLPAAAQHTLRGKVRAPSGATLTGVIVELWSSGARTGQAVTTGDGDFYFTGVAPGNYDLIVNHLGYQPATERVRITVAQNEGRIEMISVEIQLKPDAKTNSAVPPGITFAQDIPPAARKAFDEGVARIKEGRSSEGVALLREAIKIFPDYFNANFALASELSKSESATKEALQLLERARQVNDRDARIYHLFGILMARERKYLVAEFAFREAIQRDPTNAQSYFSHAITLIELAIKNTDQTERRNDLNNAERDLNRALELSDRKLQTAYLQLGRVYEHRGDRKGAAKMLETYLKLQPDDKNAAAIRAAIVKLNQ